MSNKHGHQARKRFGQNFLHDPGVIERIVRSINPKPDDAIVEIGPGLGAITEEILAINPRLQVVELDRDLIPVLRTKFFNYPEFQIHEADALSFDFRELMTDRPLRIVGNLPYNISTPLIFHLLEQSGVVQDMHFMLQKEVVQRLAAVPGDNNYGRLGIMAQYFCKVQPLFEVGPRSEEHTSELQSRPHLVCRLLLEKKNKYPNIHGTTDTCSSFPTCSPTQHLHGFVIQAMKYASHHPYKPRC